jgi:hypothetical protein
VTNRPDFSEYVVHFTKATSPWSLTQHPEDPWLQQVQSMSAADRFRAILNEQTIRATWMPFTDALATCFTECVYESLQNHARSYSGFGIGFSKGALMGAGGGPALYVKGDVWESSAWSEIARPFVTPFKPLYGPADLRGRWPAAKPFLDFSHEREWRVPHDFHFTYEDIAFLVVDRLQNAPVIQAIVAQPPVVALAAPDVAVVRRFWPYV